MIGIEEYRNIVSDLMDELPEEFFRDLSGGVIVSEASALADYAVRNDVYLMGEYLVYSGIRQIVLFKGSFDRVYPLADADEAKRILRGVLRHEFRHHLESLGGVHNSSSLEAEDARKKAAYLARFRRQGKENRIRRKKEKEP
ncbi:MAG: hypothetical protein IIU08_10200 [Clostridia bacterium]|nr:hypothetical protein [Clostridia bacterium]